MTRTCIICGAPARSREHIFPAALGGRRTNRGIYCGTHNNAFSGLARVLSDQLGMWNALLGVRPDRATQARVLNLTTPEGDELVVSTGQVRRSSTSPVAPEEGIHLRLTLGGPEGLPAIGYVALTFFVHHFGDAARQPGLDPIKAFIQRDGQNDFVWWESDTNTRGLPANPFPFGHTIILTTAAATGEARAVISLFQTLTFGIALGSVPGTADRTVTVFIDPHADREPIDTQERCSDAVEMAIVKPQPMHAHLERMVRQGDGQDLLQGLQARIERWQFDNEMGPVLERLNAAAVLPVAERVRTIQGIVEEQASRIHRLMRLVVRDFAEMASAQTIMAPVLAEMRNRIAYAQTETGLSELADEALARSIVSFIRELSGRVSQRALDMEELWLLFSGGQGAHMVLEILMGPFMSRIGAPSNWNR